MAARTAMHLATSEGFTGRECPIGQVAFEATPMPARIATDPPSHFWDLAHLLQWLNTRERNGQARTHPITNAIVPIQDIHPIVVPQTRRENYVRAIELLSANGWRNDEEIRADARVLGMDGEALVERARERYVERAPPVVAMHPPVVQDLWVEYCDMIRVGHPLSAQTQLDVALLMQFPQPELRWELLEQDWMLWGMRFASLRMRQLLFFRSNALLEIDAFVRDFLAVLVHGDLVPLARMPDPVEARRLFVGHMRIAVADDNARQFFVFNQSPVEFLLLREVLPRLSEAEVRDLETRWRTENEFMEELHEAMVSTLPAFPFTTYDEITDALLVIAERGEHDRIRLLPGQRRGELEPAEPAHDALERERTHIAENADNAIRLDDSPLLDGLIAMADV